MFKAQGDAAYQEIQQQPFQQAGPDRLAAGSLHECLAKAPNRLSLLIGPEGGFSGGEVESLLGSGFTPVHLGDTVLRSETAALAALAAVKMILQERSSWKLSE